MDFSKLTYKFQRLIIQDTMPTVMEFKIETLKGLFVPQVCIDEVYTFIERMQSYPKKHGLALAMDGVFEYLISHIKEQNSKKENFIEYISELKHRNDIPYKEYIAFCNVIPPNDKKNMDMIIRLPSNLFSKSYTAMMINTRVKKGSILTPLRWNKSKISRLGTRYYEYGDPHKYFLKYIHNYHSVNKITIDTVDLTYFITFAPPNKRSNWSFKSEEMARHHRVVLENDIYFYNKIREA